MSAVLEKAASGQLSAEQAQHVLTQVAETTSPNAALGNKFPSAELKDIQASFAKMTTSEKRAITNLNQDCKAAGNEGPNLLAKAGRKI